jgi:hypothetical protein
VKDPFVDLLELMLGLWRDALFLKLLAAVVAFSTGFAVFTDSEWETILGMVGMGCLAAMLEVTLRPRS